MMDYELELLDRIEAVKKYVQGKESDFYMSFSGGRDSTAVSHLVDMALPGNKIPRVFINTGIEYNAIVEFVHGCGDPRLVELMPRKPIISLLKEVGYPFKSKEHSLKIHYYKRGSQSPNIMKYKRGGQFGCPKCLMYQYGDDFKLNISNRCCYELKKDPVHKWAHGRIAITGMMKDEGGERTTLQCLTKTTFNPFAKIDKEWEDEFIKLEKIPLCKLYYPPYNFKRTGCKGCPYNLHLQEQLDTMARLMPVEERQCEIIWKPVYDEYRRINYRLKKDVQEKSFDD